LIVPHLTRLQNEEQRGVALSKITRTSLVLNLILAIIVIAITPFAIRLLFGMQFLQAISVCYILLIGSMLSNMKVVFAEGLRGFGYPTVVMKGELVGLIISGVLFPILLKLYGLEGVAAASVIGYCATFLFFVISSRKLVGVSVSNSLKPQRQDFVYIFDKLIDIVRRKKISPDISK
jgi:O-antigen/teichoic acid export membrane protein